jgi:hypothetical protein
VQIELFGIVPSSIARSCEMSIIRFTSVVIALAALFMFAPVVSAQDRDCADFDSQAEAQAVFNRDPIRDPYGLDGPPGPAFDGVRYLACENLPAPTAPPYKPSIDPSIPPVVDPGGQQIIPPTGAADSLAGLVLAAGALVGVGALVRRRGAVR